MTPLPLCRWRGILRDDHHACSSPRRPGHNQTGATPEDCLTCNVCNHLAENWAGEISAGTLDPETGEYVTPGTRELKPPPWWKMAVNLAVAVAQHAAAGFPTVTPEELDRRLAICKACPKWMKDDERCSLCGCWMKGKAAWREQKCFDSENPRW